jgi:CBS domain-containing protein
MRLQELMSTQVESISRNATAAEAIARMRQMRVRHLIVSDGGKAVGVLSDRDLENLGTMAAVETVGERMSHPIVTATPDTTVRKAANLLRGRSIGCLPVVDGERVVGIVTTADLLELIGRGAERPVPKPRRWTLAGRGPGRRPPGSHAARRQAAAR